MASKTRVLEDRMPVKEQKPDLTAEHPFNNKDNHELLLQYCKERIEAGRAVQGAMHDRMEEIDKEFYGYMKYTKEDLERRRKQLLGESTSPTEMRAAFMLAQIFRMVTFLVSVFSPDSGIYEINATKSQQSLGNALTQLMNKHAIKGGYFRHQAMFFLDTLKYNLACFEADWLVEQGKKLVDQGGKLKTEDTNTFEGNQMIARDMYNVFWEPLINPCDVYKKAEYAGYVEVCSLYQLKKRTQDGLMYNTKGLWKQTSGLDRTEGYYKQPPAVRYDLSVNDTGGGTDFVHILSMGQTSGPSMNFYERATLYVRLIPTEFGLVPRANRNTRNKFEIWRIRIINGNRIVEATHMPNVHDYIPMFFGRPFEDQMGGQAKGPAETLSPFQQFANFLLNNHVKSARKNLYDITIYDPLIVNLAQIKDDVAARIPMLPAGHGKDPKQSIWRPDTKLDTKETMGQIKELLELMEYIFPTRMLQQVGQIDRAVTDQISALLAAAYRDSWKIARVLDEQALSPMRFVLVSNIKQFQTTFTVTTEQGEQDVSASALRNTEFEFKVGEGLKMIDKLTTMSIMKEVINMILQSQAVAEFDVPALVNYFSSLGGVETDLRQFRRITPPVTSGAQPASNAAQPGAATVPPGGAPQPPAVTTS